MLRYSFHDEICVGYEANINESWGSENSSAADNQQERLVKIGWITGFVDGEGCFSIHVVRQPHRSNRRGYRTGFQVAHRTAKRLDFERFVACMQVIRTNAHLTPSGLLQIVEIMQTMNHCKPRPEMIRILRDYMPDTEFNPVKI